MKIVLAIGAGLLLFAMVSFLVGTLVWLVWPVAMVETFSAPELSWWQSVCLSYMCALLFKNTNNTRKD